MYKIGSSIAATVLCFVLVPGLHAQQALQRGRVDVARTTGGVVATVSPPASLIGRDVLVRGGNAVDGAVATGICTCSDFS